MEGVAARKDLDARDFLELCLPEMLVHGAIDSDLNNGLVELAEHK